MPINVLVVEDDRSTAETIELYLRQEGYSVHVAPDGSSGLDQARSGRYSLVILDLMLPGIYGMDVLRALREESAVPVIMLTARTLEEDQIRGLDAGADDYVTKPFSPRQLMARVRSALRRHGSAGRPPSRAGALVVDPDQAQAHVDGRALALTPTELRILDLFARSSGRLLTRDEIVSHAFPEDFDGFDRAVDVHIKNIRRKLGSGSARIETVFGSGYRLNVGPPA